MNVVFCRYKNICEPDYIDALRKLGINIVEVYINEIRANSLEEKAEALGEIIRKNTPIFVFLINFFPYVSIVCDSLKINYVSVSVTCPMMEIFNVTVRNKCNKIFLFDYEQFLSVKDENPAGIFYLPLGVNVERMDVATKEVTGFKYDVSFVGSLYNEKDPFAELNLTEENKLRYETLMHEQISTSAYGQDYLESEITDDDVTAIKDGATNFYSSSLSVRNMDRYVAINNYLSPHMTYLERIKILNAIAENISPNNIHLFTKSDSSRLKNVVVHGGVETLKEMPQVFKASKINLNITTRSMKTGLAQRIWDVLGAGGFLITNYQEEIPEYLEIGKHLDVYEDAKELSEKLKFYLKNEERRQEIAANGYQYVKETSTTLNRVMSIITAISNK